MSQRKETAAQGRSMAKSCLWRDCLPTDPRRGGGLRSAQIAEVVNSLDIGWLELAIRRVRRPVPDSVAGWRLAVSTPGALAMTGRMRRRVANRLAVFEGLAGDIGFPRCVLWENTKDHSLLLFARRHRIPVIALPHNIESLGSPEQLRYAQMGIHKRFRHETALLAQADRIFTISTWDQWLLRLFGIESDVYAYAPPVARRLLLDRVRAQRCTGAANDGPLLIVGTADYAPSRRGMQALLAALGPIAARAGVPMVVAGFGTEALRSDCPPGIEIRGAISDHALLDLYARARAGVVYQPPATGALTRIADLLVAGVPVYANTHAARSQPQRPGLVVYDDFEVLIRLLDAGITADANPSGYDAGTAASAGAHALQTAIHDCLAAS